MDLPAPEELRGAGAGNVELRTSQLMPSLVGIFASNVTKVNRAAREKAHK